MVPGKPALWDTVTPLWKKSAMSTLGPLTTHVLDHMAMIADEQESAAVRQIDLHACAAQVGYISIALGGSTSLWLSHRSDRPCVPEDDAE